MNETTPVKHKRLLIERGSMKVKNRSDLKVLPKGDFTKAHLLIFYESPRGRTTRVIDPMYAKHTNKVMF